MRILERDGGWVFVQIPGIEIHNVAQHRIAPFFSVEIQHLANLARIRERKKQVLSVEAVVEPYAWRGVDQPVDRLRCRTLGTRVVGDCTDALLELLRYIHRLGSKNEDFAEPKELVMPDCRINFDKILDKDHCDRALLQRVPPFLQEMVEIVVAHWLCSFLHIRNHESQFAATVAGAFHPV